MKKVWEKLGELIRHNTGLTVAIVIACSLLFWVGCESTTTSMSQPSVKVTRPQYDLEYKEAMANLEGQLETMKGKYEIGIQDLNRQDAFKQKLFEIGVAYAEGGTLNPIGVATSLIALLGIGVGVDNLVKNKIIKTQQAK